MKTIIDRFDNTLPLNRYELTLTPTRAISRTLRVSHRSLEGIAETVVNRGGMRVVSGLLSRRLLQNVISQVLEVKDVSGITALWTPVIQELLASGCDLVSLAKHSIPRVANLAKVALNYRSRLRSLNCLDRSELFWQAADFADRKKSCLIYGYFMPNLAQIAFIDAVTADNSCLVLPTEDKDFFASNYKCIEWLQSRGWQVVNNCSTTEGDSLAEELKQWYLAKSDRPQELKFYKYSNLDAEVRGVLAQVKLLLQQGIRANEIVLIAEDEKLYGNALLDIAWEYNLPLRAFYDVSFLTTRFGAWLQLLLEVITEVNSSEKLNFENATKLLFHPLVKKMTGEIWQQAKIIYPQTITAWQEIGIDLTCLQLPQETNGINWQEIFKQMLKSFSIEQNIKPWAKEIIAYYKFQDILAELFLNNEITFGRTQFINEIQELIKNLTIPVQPGRGGVEFHPVTSLFGSQYKYVFVLGMAENIFPAAINEDLVLNYRDRKAILEQDRFEISERDSKQLTKENLSLNTILSLTQKSELGFYFLLQIPTKKITFSYPQSLEKKYFYPSPYLANLEATGDLSEYLVSPEEIDRFYLRQPEKVAKKTKLAKLLAPEKITLIDRKWQVACDRENNLQNEYNGLVKIPLDSSKLTFSASQLTQIGQCPFKWFAARILKLKEIVETELTLANNTRGSLYHKCLELYLADVNTAADLEKFNSQQLERVFNLAIQQLQIPDLLGWTQQQQELLKLLEINLTAPDFLTPDSQIIEREKEFTTKWHGLKVTGTIDRLDKTNTGIQVIDYKSSSTAPLGIKDEFGKANIDLQIPLYIDAITQEYPENKVTAVYYSLSKCKPIRRNQTDPEKLANFAEKVKEYVTTGNYPIAPDIQFKACNYCQYDLVCRIRKNVTQNHK